MGSRLQSRITPPIRPEIRRSPENADDVGDIARKLGLWERITDMTVVRRLFVLVLVIGAWQIYAMIIKNPLMFPTFSATITSFWNSIMEGVLLARAWVSVKTLLE